MRRSHVLPPVVALASVASLAAPRRVRRVARTGVGTYALGLAVATLQASRSADLRETAGLPLVLTVMHLSNGFGFLDGCWRYGPPLAALARLPRRRVT